MSEITPKPCMCGEEVSIRGHLKVGGGVVVIAERDRWNRWIFQCKTCWTLWTYHGAWHDAIESWNDRPGEKTARRVALEEAFSIAQAFIVGLAGKDYKLAYKRFHQFYWERFEIDKRMPELEARE